MATTDVSTIDARLEFLRRQIHALNLAIAQAKARGDQAAIDGMRSTYRKLAAEIVQLQADAKKAEMPSSFMLALSDFSDEAIEVGKQVGEATLTTLKALPIILTVALIVIGLIYAGKIRHGLK